MESFRREKEQYEKVAKKRSEYIKRLEQGRGGYRDLAKDYKKPAGGPILTLDVGLGTIGGSTDSATFVVVD